MATPAGVDLSSINVERDHAVTIYEQLCEQLRQMIHRGDLLAGARLPSTRVFAEEVEVSRITAREVYDQLSSEGYLTSAVGRGTFVRNLTSQINTLTKPARTLRRKPKPGMSA